MSDFAAQYNTALAAEEEAQYLKWREQLSAKRGYDMALDEEDYDLRGAWKAGAKEAANGHLPDQFKKPNHPTFSVESQYSGASGVKGGEWTKVNDRWRFVASPDMLKFRSPAQMHEYFSRVEPDSELVLPEQPTDSPTGIGRLAAPAFGWGRLP